MIPAFSHSWKCGAIFAAASGGDRPASSNDAFETAITWDRLAVPPEIFYFLKSK